MTIRFITFGGGGQGYIDAGHRLINQIGSLNLFDKTTLFTDTDLMNDKDFWGQHGDFIKKNKRGYGYWLWKPYIIKKTIDEMEDGDSLLYLDAGCEVDIKKKTKISNLLRLVKTELLIGTYAGYSSFFNEANWNKMDLLVHLGMNRSGVLTSKQRQGGTNLFLVGPKTRQLVNKWYEVCCNYHLIDDSASVKKNTPGFREHRHDQSVFSLLTKKYNLYSQTTLTGAIEVWRNKTGKSKLNTRNRPRPRPRPRSTPRPQSKTTIQDRDLRPNNIIKMRRQLLQKGRQKILELKTMRQK